MAIPNQALVLVTDGRKLLFLRNHGDENQIDLRTESHDQRPDRKDSEIKTDAAGSQGQRWGDARPAMGDMLPDPCAQSAVPASPLPRDSAPAQGSR